jgi:hypothetical protein
MSDLPKGWKTVKLPDILTPAQLHETMKILRLPITDFDKTAKLKLYYAQFRAELEDKGIDSSYLAYAVLFWIKRAE